MEIFQRDPLRLVKLHNKRICNKRLKSKFPQEEEEEEEEFSNDSRIIQDDDKLNSSLSFDYLPERILSYLNTSEKCHNSSKLDDILARQRKWAERKELKLNEMIRNKEIEAENQTSFSPNLHDSLQSWKYAQKKSELELKKIQLLELERKTKQERFHHAHEMTSTIETNDHDKPKKKKKSKVKVSKQLGQNQAEIENVKNQLKTEELLLSNVKTIPNMDYLKQNLIDKLKYSPYNSKTKSKNKIFIPKYYNTLQEESLNTFHSTKMIHQEEILEATNWFSKMMKMGVDFNLSLHDKSKLQSSETKIESGQTVYPTKTYDNTVSIIPEPIRPNKVQPENTKQETSSSGKVLPVTENDVTRKSKIRLPISDPRDFDSSTIVRHIDSTNPSVAYLLGYFRNSEVNSLQIITVIFDPNIFSQTEAEIWWGINKSRILDQYN